MADTILFGNGINRLSLSNVSWSELLTNIKGPRIFPDDRLPNTMIYERIILDRPSLHKSILPDEFEVKSLISDSMYETVTHDLYIELFKLNATNYLTTNYDYSFIDTIQLHNHNQIRIESHRPEDIYSLRRQKKIYLTIDKYKSLWQLHGEIERPASIMLGLDHYCGSIGKIDSYIKGGYEYRLNGKQEKEFSIDRKFRENSFNGSSWVELFFNSNIHIIGFKLDYTETDLWWIINKRARMLKDERMSHFIKNRIDFYCDEMDEQKEDLLESMNVRVHRIKRASGFPNKYEAHYAGLLNVLSGKII